MVMQVRRSLRLDTTVRPYTQVRQQAEGRVVGDQSLEIARNGTQYTHHLNQVDRDAEEDQEWAERCSCDEVSCHTEQPNAAGDHDAAQEYRQCYFPPKRQ